MTTKVPGYYRNPELSILPLFSRNTDIAAMWAKKLLSFEDHTRWLDEEQTIPLRRYFKPKLSGGKDCLHTPQNPCPWCLPGGQFVNQNNPMTRFKNIVFDFDIMINLFVLFHRFRSLNFITKNCTIFTFGQ